MASTILRPFCVLMGKKSNNKIIHRVAKSKLLTCLSGIIKYNCGTVLKNRLPEEAGSARKHFKQLKYSFKILDTSIDVKRRGNDRSYRSLLSEKQCFVEFLTLS